TQIFRPQDPPGVDTDPKPDGENAAGKEPAGREGGEPRPPDRVGSYQNRLATAGAVEGQRRRGGEVGLGVGRSAGVAPWLLSGGVALRLWSSAPAKFAEPRDKSHTERPDLRPR